jgi:hypothetical protein
MPVSSCTAKQAAVLEKYGYSADCSFEDASATIQQLADNGWQPLPGGPQPVTKPQPARQAAPQQRAPQRQAPAPARPAPQRQAPANQETNRRDTPTPRMAATLEKFGYDPNVTFDEARQILDDLAANNWQPIESAATVEGFDDANDVPFSN